MEYESKSIPPMNSKAKISDVNMTAAKNGIIISYCEKTENNKKGTFDNCSYEYPKEVFDFDSDDGEKDMTEAFERFKELWKMQYPEMKFK